MSERARRSSRKGRRGLAWMLPALFPAGAVVWFLAQEAETRQALLARVPQGTGERAVEAGLGFCVLVGLAWIVLPVAYHGQRISRRALGWCVSRSLGQRILLSPGIAILAIASGIFGVLFALDAVAIVVAFAGTLLLGVWIVEPGFFGGREAILGLFGG